MILRPDIDKLFNSLSEEVMCAKETEELDNARKIITELYERRELRKHHDISTLDEEITAKYRNVKYHRGREPQVASCRITWLDDQSKCDVVFLLSTSHDLPQGYTEEDIFYYTDSIDSLLALKSVDSGEDFILDGVYCFDAD